MNEWNEAAVELWNRQKVLQIDFDLEDPEEEDPSPVQLQALDSLCHQPQFFEEAKEQVIVWMIRRSPEQFPTGIIKNVFRVLEPEVLLIPADQDSLHAILLCDYRYESDGIGIDIVDGNVLQIGPADCFWEHEVPCAF